MGDIVRYSRTSKETGIGKGAYAQVKSIDAPKNRLKVELQDGAERTYDPRRQQGVSVFREEMRSFSVGDRIQFTAPANELRVANRELGTIETIGRDERLTLKMDGGRAVELDPSKHPHLDRGYAMTSHSSQEQTADRVLIHVDTELGAKDLLNCRMAYLSVSRGAYDAQLFTNDRGNEVVSLTAETILVPRIGHCNRCQPVRSATRSWRPQTESANAPWPTGYAPVGPRPLPLPAGTATTSNSGCRPASPVENGHSWWPGAQKDALGPLHVGHEHAIGILRGFEELILLTLLRVLLLLVLVAQGDKAVSLAPTFRLIAEFALLIGVGLGRALPVGGLQSFQQTRGLAGHDDEVRLGLLVGLDGFPTIEAGIGPRENGLDAFGQGPADTLQMACNLFPIRPIAIAQFSPNVDCAGTGRFLAGPRHTTVPIESRIEFYAPPTQKTQILTAN